MSTDTLLTGPRPMHGQLHPWGYVGPALAWTVAFFAVPIVIMLAYSTFQRTGGRIVKEVSFANYEEFFQKSHHIQALLNSIEVTLITTVVSVLLAYPLAYILAFRVPRQWQRLAILMAILPFWTSYIVRSYSWILVLSGTGIVSGFLQWLGITDERLSLAYQQTGTIIGFVHFFTMLLTLTIFANLVQVSPNYIRAASDLGASRVQAFIWVLLPLSLPGVMVGAFLTFVLALGDYVTPQVLGGNKSLVLPQAIMIQIQRQADFPMAATMSFVLMVVVSAAMLLCGRWLKMDRV
ncbi:MAG: ABC transporter permease [Rhodospirillaceae bacterium]|nr:ABC transporter permease [Rhodospirillaceae bacterium]